MPLPLASLVMVPQSAALGLLQETVQVALTEAPLAVALKVCWAPPGRVTELGLTTRPGTKGAGGGFRVTVATPVLVVSALETAVMVTTEAVVRVAGAV